MPEASPLSPAQLSTYFSVTNECCHGGETGLDALMPRQLILLEVVQELVQDPMETGSQPEILEHSYILTSTCNVMTKTSGRHLRMES